MGESEDCENYGEYEKDEKYREKYYVLWIIYIVHKGVYHLRFEVSILKHREQVTIQDLIRDLISTTNYL